jgi:hypothetical protein
MRETRITLRMPFELGERIAAEATANSRSMNAEIVSRLAGSPAAAMVGLRDQFAMAVATGFVASMAHPDSGGPANHYASDVAEYAYSVADAMLAERAKGGAS